MSASGASYILSGFRVCCTKKRKKKGSWRVFGNTLCEELAIISKGFVAQNTEKNSHWTKHIFQQWQEARCVWGNLAPDKLCCTLPLAIPFVSEMGKTDGSLYIHQKAYSYQLLCGISCYIKQDIFALNFLKHKNTISTSCMAQVSLCSGSY